MRKDAAAEHGLEVTGLLETQLMLLVRNLELLRQHRSTGQDLDAASYLLLRTLCNHGPARINQLATRLGLDASTVTRQVTTMHAAGLVARTTSSKDRRFCIVAPTGRGLDVMHRHQHRRHGLVGELTTGWTARQLRMLGTLLRKLNESIHAATLGD
ncbi:MAG: MarR family winged helix-turn-helix transcriptional regulator [Sciscionella sp.]